MYREIRPERFDDKTGKWIMEIVMNNGYVQVITSPVRVALENYRNEFLKFVQQETQVH